jgi:outer membrane receptor protein involved in Fe transport
MPAADQELTALFRRWSLYGYHSWQIVEPLQLVAGLTYDRLAFPEVFRTVPLSKGQESLDQFSPKAGLIWTPTAHTTVRAAYTRSISGATLDQSQQIEPTQVAGFLQSFRSLIPESIAGPNAGARFETYNLSLEKRFQSGTYLGLAGELLYSDLKRTVGTFSADFFVDEFPSPGRLSEALDFRERSLVATAHQLIGENLSLGARYRLTEAELNDRFALPPSVTVSDFAAAQNPESLLHQLGLFAVVNHDSGFFARAEGLWNVQRNSGYDPAQSGANFWHFNLWLGYRLAQRRVEVSAGLLNIGDRDYRLNPLTLHNDLPRDRTLVTRLVINF